MTHRSDRIHQTVNVDDGGLENAEFGHAFRVNAQGGKMVLEDVEGLKQSWLLLKKSKLSNNKVCGALMLMYKVVNNNVANRASYLVHSMHPGALSRIALVTCLEMLIYLYRKFHG